MFYSDFYCSCVCYDSTRAYLYIQVADLTLTQQVCAAAGQGGVNSTATCLDDLMEELGKHQLTILLFCLHL